MADTDDETETDAETNANDAGLPTAVAERITELTRRSRAALDDGEAYETRRETLLSEYGYRMRVREDDTREVVVCHPEEWVDEEGRIRIGQIEDTDRAVEIPLSGPGEADDWETIETHNRTLADRIDREYGPAHGANAHAFADFIGNHYAKPIEAATPAEREEFRTEYFPRNVWPTETQREVLEESLALLAALEDFE